MSNCTDCIPQVPDLCKGKRIWTNCVLSKDPIPAIGVVANEPLNITLEKLGLLIQSCCGGVSTTIPNWEEKEYLSGVLVFHNNAIWRSEENENINEPDITNNSWTMLSDITKPTTIIQMEQPEILGDEVVIPTNEKTIQYLINGTFAEQTQEVSFQIVPTQSEEYFRKDIIVGHLDGSISLIQGEESETEVIDPVTPEGTILLTSYVIIGNQVEEVETINPDIYIPKKSEGWLTHAGSTPFSEVVLTVGDWHAFNFNYNSSYSAVFGGFKKDSSNTKPWGGATVYLKNNTNYPITLKHMSSNPDAKIKLEFEDGKDFILRKEDGVIMFKLSNLAQDGTGKAYHINKRNKELKRYNAVYSMSEGQSESLDCPEIGLKITINRPTTDALRIHCSKYTLDGDNIYDITAVNLYNSTEKQNQDGVVINSLDPLAQYILTISTLHESDNLVNMVISRASDNETWHGTIVSSDSGGRVKILLTQEVVGT